MNNQNKKRKNLLFGKIKFDDSGSQDETLKDKYINFINQNKLLVSCGTGVLTLVVIGACIFQQGDTQSMQTVELDNTEEIVLVASNTESTQDVVLVDAGANSDHGIAAMENPVASVEAYQIVANGQPLATLETKEHATEILEDLIDLYTDGDSTLKKSYFAEDVQIQKAYIPITMIEEYDTTESAIDYIVRGTDEEKNYKIQSGDNFWYLASVYDISVDDLMKANPKVNPTTIQIGQEISLIVPKPLISVNTVEEKTYMQNIDYDVVYEDTNSLFKGEYKTKISGVYGEEKVVAEVVKQNGREVGQVILSEEVVSSPRTKVIYAGTKNPPPRMGTGTFIYPASRGVVTSEFGYRWGRRHSGIDLGMPTGTSVKASDGGVVTQAGWDSSYGYYVKIDHGANLSTIYAHNSQLLVSAGQKVYQGQQIALSGNTGNSTGPHLHFEVRVNNIPQNPRGYVGF